MALAAEAPWSRATIAPGLVHAEVAATRSSFLLVGSGGDDSPRVTMTSADGVTWAPSKISATESGLRVVDETFVLGCTRLQASRDGVSARPIALDAPEGTCTQIVKAGGAFFAMADRRFYRGRSLEGPWKPFTPKGLPELKSPRLVAVGSDLVVMAAAGQRPASLYFSRDSGARFEALPVDELERLLQLYQVGDGAYGVGFTLDKHARALVSIEPAAFADGNERTARVGVFVRPMHKLGLPAGFDSLGAESIRLVAGSTTEALAFASMRNHTQLVRSRGGDSWAAERGFNDWFRSTSAGDRSPRCTSIAPGPKATVVACESKGGVFVGVQRQ